MTFTAIILAAGVGSRLRPLTDRVPKCLVPVGRETILGRMVRLLAEAGAREVIVSTGYREAQVREALAASPVPARFAHNPDHATTQNVVSLRRALALVDGGAVVKLDGDVVFEAAVIARLLGADGDAQVALEDGAPPPDEAMKVTARRGLVTRFGKGLDAREAAGESIGIERFGDGARARLARALDRAVAAGRTDVYYEEVYNDLVDEGLGMRCVSVGDLAWTEIDDADDLAAARARFGP